MVWRGPDQNWRLASTLAIAGSLLVAGILACGPASQKPQPDELAAREARQSMRAEIENDIRLLSRDLGKSALDPRVLEAMTAVPRHEFVPQDLKGQAYENRPLSIGRGQTISQPSMVALMTDLLEVGSEDRVLEIGTGSGYQAAILSTLVDEVYTIEIIAELGRQAAQRLERLGYANVSVRVGDGFYGWPEKAPFDGIIVTAATPEVPPPLVEQLKAGAKMVLPFGQAGQVQTLIVVDKLDDGSTRTQEILPVAFVPFTRQ